MDIRLRNIAKIAEADIKADGVSIIGGYNDTGKSTVLKSIYASVNLFRNADQKVRAERRSSLFSAIADRTTYFDPDGYGGSLAHILINFADMFSERWFRDGNESFTAFKQIFRECASRDEEAPDQQLDDQIFTDEFLRPIYEKVEEVLKRPRETYMKYIGEMYIRSAFSGQMNHLGSNDAAKIQIQSEDAEHYLEVKENRITDMSYASVSKPDAIYLPTYNVLDLIKDRSSRFRFRTGNRYSMEDELRKYLTSEGDARQTYEAYSEREANISAIREILKEVVHGELQMEGNGKLSFKDDGLEKGIDMSNVASGMKTFLVIQKLVENGYLKKNGILLIDEPETNLHPEWHLKFAEIIVLMYKYMGISTVANSHSPYFIRAIEVKLADYGMKENGNFYLMEKMDNGRCYLKNVTDRTNELYQRLYMPLQYL